MDIRFAVWTAGLVGDAIILINITSGIGLLNRAARAVTALAAILRQQPTVASQLVLVSVLQLLGFSAIFPILAQSNAYSPFSRFHPFYLLALVVGNLLPSMGGEKPYYWWNGNCIECPVDRVA